MEIRWMATLPSLTHFAFAFYYEVPLGMRIVETMALVPQMECVVPVVFPSSMAQGSPARRAASVSAAKKELRKLDDPKVVVWSDSPSSLAAFDDVNAETFWKLAEKKVEAQKLEKELELGYPTHETQEMT
jgi:hypothetical protein